MSTADPTYDAKVYLKQGAEELIVASGGTERVQSGGVLDIESGGALKVAGVDMTAAIAALPPATNYAVGVGSGYKIARGQHTQVAASDTVVTGLTTVVAVVAEFDSAPTVKQLFLAASIGDQAGTPAAGSILLKTFKPTAVDNVTPTAATDFTDNLKINWIAVGT